MLGTGSVGEAVMVGETERADRLGEKKDVSLDDVLEKDDDLPWGAETEEDVLAERICGELPAFDALLRGIVQEGDVDSSGRECPRMKKNGRGNRLRNAKPGTIRRREAQKAGSSGRSSGQERAGEVAAVVGAGDGRNEGRRRLCWSGVGES